MKSLRFSLSILLGASETFFCFSAASVLGSSLFPVPVLVEEGVGWSQSWASSYWVLVLVHPRRKNERLLFSPLRFQKCSPYISGSSSIHIWTSSDLYHTKKRFLLFCQSDKVPWAWHISVWCVPLTSFYSEVTWNFPIDVLLPSCSEVPSGYPRSWWFLFSWNTALVISLKADLPSLVRYLFSHWETVVVTDLALIRGLYF